MQCHLETAEGVVRQKSEATDEELQAPAEADGAVKHKLKG